MPRQTLGFSRRWTNWSGVNGTGSSIKGFGGNPSEAYNEQVAIVSMSGYREVEKGMVNVTELDCLSIDVRSES